MRVRTPGQRLGSALVLAAGFVLIVGIQAYTSGTWATKRAMPTARNRFQMGVIANQIYTTGGWNGAHRLDVQSYSPSSDFWQTYANAPAQKTAAATAVIGSTMYMAGGTDCCVEVNSGYAFTAGNLSPTWVAIAPMPTTRQGAIGAAINNQFYVVGGFASPNTMLSVLERYAPLTNTWTASPRFPHRAASPAAK